MTSKPGEPRLPDHASDGGQNVVSLRADLGPGMQLVDLSDLLQHITDVAEFGVQLHDENVRHNALRELAPSIFGERVERESYVGWVMLVGPTWLDRTYEIDREFALVAEDYVRTRALRVSVNQLSYSNPFEVKLSLSVLSDQFVQVLRIIRDWGAQRRLSKARAAEYESSVTARARLRQYYVDQIVRSGTTSLSPGQVAELLTPQLATSLDVLGGVHPEVEANGEPME